MQCPILSARFDYLLHLDTVGISMECHSFVLLVCDFWSFTYFEFDSIIWCIMILVVSIWDITPLFCWYWLPSVCFHPWRFWRHVLLLLGSLSFRHWKLVSMSWCSLILLVSMWGSSPFLCWCSDYAFADSLDLPVNLDTGGINMGCHPCVSLMCGCCSFRRWDLGPISRYYWYRWHHYGMSFLRSDDALIIKFPILGVRLD